MMMAGNSSKRLNTVQLGFSVPFEDQEHRLLVGHNLPLWRDWDGGQIGGRPSWLQPRDIPKHNALYCSNCEKPLCFVCQLYAPADEISASAFHRSLYVFCCKSKSCLLSLSSSPSSGIIRVLRGQLPQENQFYPIEPTSNSNSNGEGESEDKDNDQSNWMNHFPETYGVKLCKVCGVRGHEQCPIQGVFFCGKHHQNEHKAYIFDKQQLSKSSDFTFLPSVYTESELVVEEEPNMPRTSNVAKKGKDDALFVEVEDDDEDDDDDDLQLEQQDLNNITGAITSPSSNDPTTMNFYARVNGPPDVQEQCLRYLRWPSEQVATDSDTPLWIRSDHQPPKDSIPNCSHCGCKRNFEFQIMPQMLHYLLKDHQTQRAHAAVKNSIKTEQVKQAVMTAKSIIEQAPPEQVSPQLVDAKEKAVDDLQKHILGDNEDELDWGVIVVYTCTGSCGDSTEPVDPDSPLGAYKEEFAWIQPSL